jgi:hypothetical protein
MIALKQTKWPAVPPNPYTFGCDPIEIPEAQPADVVMVRYRQQWFRFLITERDIADRVRWHIWQRVKCVHADGFDSYESQFDIEGVPCARDNQEIVWNKKARRRSVPLTDHLDRFVA